MKRILADLSLEEITALNSSYGEPSFRAKQIYGFVKDGAKISEMSNLPLKYREKLLADFEDVGLYIEKKLTSKDGTVKYLYRLNDGNIVEGVLMSYKYGKTLCVSTQVGCRMNCAFCASGIGGLVRCLSAGEIFSQVAVVNRDAGGTAENRQVINVVLMGSGEPLDNYENVTKFLSLCRDAGISLRNVSLSTSGIVPKIIELAKSDLHVTLTISLHCTTDERRDRLMPVNKAYKIGELIGAAKFYFEKTGRRVIFEYALIAGENDGEKDAERLHALTSGFPSHVNLIPLNPVKEKGLKSPDRSAVEKFLKKLEELGTSATIRRTMGQDIEGACGQLRRSYLEARNDG